jgi:hypothetical protein
LIGKIPVLLGESSLMAIGVASQRSAANVFRTEHWKKLKLRRLFWPDGRWCRTHPLPHHILREKRGEVWNCFRLDSPQGGNCPRNPRQ